MPEKLSDEEVEKILQRYDDVGSYRKVSEALGYDKKTVKKYVERNRDVDDSGDKSDSERDGMVVDLEGGDGSLVDLTEGELMQLSPSEFVETFFEEFDEMGVRDSFIQMISNQASIRQQIPDEDQMSQRLQQHNSGIGNANDANVIAELYWALAERYLQSRGLAGPGGMMNGSATFGGGQKNGEWVGAGQQQNSPGQQTDGGSWVGAEPQQPNSPHDNTQPNNQFGGQNQYGAPNQQSGTTQMMRQMMEQQQAMMQQMMQQQQQDEKDELRREIAELKEQIGSDNGGGGLSDSLKEVVELREMLNELEGSDDGGSSEVEEVAAVLQRQLQDLQHQIESDNSADMGQIMSQNDSQFGLLAALAQSGDVNPTEMVQLAQQLGEVETHPEVAEKKYEKEIEEMKVESEKEKWDSILSGAEELATTFGAALTGAVPSEESVGGGAGSERQNQSGQTDGSAGVDHTQNTPGEQQSDTSPAEQIVQQESATEDVEDQTVEVEGVTPDTNTESDQVTLVETAGDTPTIEGVEESESQEEEVEVVTAGRGEGAETVDNEVEASEDDRTEQDVYVCDGCGQEFDSERGLWGHSSHCPGDEE